MYSYRETVHILSSTEDCARKCLSRCTKLKSLGVTEIMTQHLKTTKKPEHWWKNKVRASWFTLVIPTVASSHLETQKSMPSGCQDISFKFYPIGKNNHQTHSFRITENTLTRPRSFYRYTKHSRKRKSHSESIKVSVLKWGRKTFFFSDGSRTL